MLGIRLEGIEYHHGDLRQALIDYALGQVRASGVGAFSVREAARAAGVSSGAAYRHFSEKDRLLAAVGLEGFSILAEQTARASAGSSGVDRLRAIGRAYITFASDEPNLFRLMFSQICKVEVKVDEARALAVPSAWTQLHEALAEVTRTETSEVDEDLAALAWSTAHGAASLICDGVWSRDDARAHAAIDEVARLALTKIRMA